MKPFVSLPGPDQVTVDEASQFYPNALVDAVSREFSGNDHFEQLKAFDGSVTRPMAARRSESPCCVPCQRVVVPAGWLAVCLLSPVLQELASALHRRRAPLHRFLGTQHDMVASFGGSRRRLLVAAGRCTVSALFVAGRNPLATEYVSARCLLQARLIANEGRGMGLCQANSPGLVSGAEVLRAGWLRHRVHGDAGAVTHVPPIRAVHTTRAPRAPHVLRLN